MRTAKTSSAAETAEAAVRRSARGAADRRTAAFVGSAEHRRYAQAVFAARSPVPARRRGAMIMASLSLALARCGVAGLGDGGSTGDGPSEPFDPPSLTFDASTLELSADRREDINLRANNIEPGRTFAVVDGTTLIAVDGGVPDAAGTLQEGLLELRLDGMLAAGEHRLELVTNGDAAVLRSSPVTLVISGVAPQQLPRLRHQGARGTVGPASHVFGRPRPDATLLGLLREDGGGWQAGVVVRGESGWLAGSPLAANVPGLNADDLLDGRDESTIHDLVDFTLRTEADDGLSYALAWREGIAGTRVSNRVLAATGPEPIRQTFTVQQAASPTGQSARVEGVRFVGDDLAVAYTSSLDAESPRPGDRQIATLRARLDDDFEFEQRVSDPALVDVDDLDDAVFIAEPDATRERVGVRRLQSRAAILDHRQSAPAVGLVKNSALDDDADFPGSSSPDFVSRISFLGALGSITVVGVRRDGRARLVQGSALSGDRQRVEIDPAPLPGVDVSGPASGAVMAGLAVVAVPFGDAAPVQVFVISGDRARTHALDDLRCDELVLDASHRAQDEAVTDLACLAAGELTLHTVALEP